MARPNINNSGRIKKPITRTTTDNAPTDTGETTKQKTSFNFLSSAWFTKGIVVVIGIVFILLAQRLMEIGAPTANMRGVTNILVALILLIAIKIKGANWQRYLKWCIIAFIVFIIAGGIFQLDQTRTGNKDSNPVQTLYNHIVDSAGEKQKTKKLTWQTVYSKQFVGVGKTGGDDPDNDGSIYTAEHGLDLFPKDRYTVYESNVEVWRSGRWNIVKPGKWIYAEKIQPGENLTFRTIKGKKFKPIVQRKMEPN